MFKFEPDVVFKYPLATIEKLFAGSNAAVSAVVIYPPVPTIIGMDATELLPELH